MNINTKQLLNFFYNTIGVTKEEIKKAILNGATEKGRQMAAKLIQENDVLIQKAAGGAIEESFKKINDRYDNSSLKNLVTKAIAERLLQDVQITLKPKEDKQ